MPSALLVAIVVVAAAVAVLAFLSGDKARRQAQGRQGPRPVASIGEAVRLAAGRSGRALVLFLGDDPASVDAARALAEDPAAIEALRDPLLVHAVVRAGGDQRDVASMLFQKHAKKPLGEGPMALLLDREGKPISVQAPVGQFGPWLAKWLTVQGDRGA